MWSFNTQKNLDLINLDEKINFNTINKKLLLILLLNCNLDLWKCHSKISWMPCYKKEVKCGENLFKLD